MAATWVVCTQCGKVQEITLDGQVPADWLQIDDALLCPACTKPNASDVLAEEVTVADPTTDLPVEDWNEGYCEVCKGPCRGH